MFLRSLCAFCWYRPGTFYQITLAIRGDKALAWADLSFSFSTSSCCSFSFGSIFGLIPLSATTLGCTARATGGGSRATWGGIAPLNNQVSFLSLSNWICKPEIEFNRYSTVSFLFAVMSLILLKRRTIAWSSGECSHSWRCWRRSSSACSIKTFLEKLMVIYAHKPRYKFFTDWAKNCCQNWTNNNKSTTLLKNQMSVEWNWFSTVK